MYVFRKSNIPKKIPKLISVGWIRLICNLFENFETSKSTENAHFVIQAAKNISSLRSVKMMKKIKKLKYW